MDIHKYLGKYTFVFMFDFQVCNKHFMGKDKQTEFIPDPRTYSFI